MNDELPSELRVHRHLEQLRRELRQISPPPCDVAALAVETMREFGQQDGRRYDGEEREYILELGRTRAAAEWLKWRADAPADARARLRSVLLSNVWKPRRKRLNGLAGLEMEVTALRRVLEYNVEQTAQILQTSQKHVETLSRRVYEKLGAQYPDWLRRERKPDHE
jgi:DNA-directed RNA polymerase specialized sigma24 family protein